MVQSRDEVKSKGLARGVDIKERNGAARGIYIGYQNYHFGAKLATLGGQTLEPLGLPAVLGSASWVFQRAIWGD